MPKDDWLHIRIDSDLKDRVQQYAKENGYDDTATLIREAIKEKIDTPKLDKDTAVREMIRSALRDDPTLLDDSLRRIGIRFYAQK
jgi:predicted transcriptional regulator